MNTPVAKIRHNDHTTDKESIIAAAQRMIHTKSGEIKMFIGKRHGNALNKGVQQGYAQGPVGLELVSGGFLTSSNRYVDRTTAMLIALDFGQVDQMLRGRKDRRLYSEDLR